MLQNIKLVLSRQPGVLGVLGDAADGRGCAYEVSYTLFLLDQLVQAGVDLAAQPVVDDEVVAHLVVAVTLGAAGHGEHQPLLDAVGVAVGDHAAGEAVTGRGGGDQGADGIGNGDGGGGGRGAAPLLDQRTTALSDSGGELVPGGCVRERVGGVGTGWGWAQAR